MSKRIADLATGFSAASAPTLTGSVATVTGTTGAPSSITAVGGITVLDVPEEIIFVEGSGGPIDITANPQISAATTAGQKLTLIGTSDANPLQLDNGNGNRQNGSKILKNGSVISYVWDGAAYKEEYRK